MPARLSASAYFRGFPLAVVPIDTQMVDKGHIHEFSELVLILAGHGQHATEGWEGRVSAGDVFVIHQSHPHRYDETAGLKLINLLFDPSALLQPADEVQRLPGFHALFTLEPQARARDGRANRLHLGPEELAVAEELSGRIREELATRAPGFEFAARALWMQLVTHLSRCYAKMRDAPPRPLLRLGAVLSRLARWEEPAPGLPELARTAHMSVSSLLRAFRRATGTTPVRYALRLRLRRAASLLRESDCRIVDAAHACGFTDSNYFARQFRLLFGQSPREFRRG